MVFFFKQKTAYEMRISDWSSDVCSSDLLYDGRLVGDLGVLQAVRHHVGRDAGLHRREVRRDGRETDEDVAGDRLAVHRLQPVGRGIEGWAHVAREEQTALEVIGTLGVGTEQPRCRSPVLPADGRAAGIGKGGVEGKSVAGRVNLGG